MGQFMTTQRGGAGAAAGSGGDDLPWWFKYVGRGFGILGGVVAVILGALNCISITAKCIVSGLWLMTAGLAALVLEAPCCFVFFDFGDKLARWSESRKGWHKVLLYMVLSIPAVIIYQGPLVIVGSAALFLAGVAYGLTSLGRKASREEMAEKAREFDRDLDGLKLVFAEKRPATADAAPGLTGDVVLDTPSSVVSTTPAPLGGGGGGDAAPAAAASDRGAAASAFPVRGSAYSPLQNEPNTPSSSSAPVVMSPFDFESPGPSPARPPATTATKEFKLAEPSASFSFTADVDQPFANPQPLQQPQQQQQTATPHLPPPPQQHRTRSGVGAATPNLINF